MHEASVKIFSVQVVEHLTNNGLWVGSSPFSVTWMDLEIITLSEVSQTKTNIIWYHLYVEYKKMIQMNLFTKQK